MTDFIEDYIKEAVWGKEEKGAGGKKRKIKGISPDKLRVRMVSNVKRTMQMTPVMVERYGVNGPFPYMARTMLVTTETEDGNDIIFLGLVVNEFGPDCPEPNRNKVYLAYVDSVQLYHKSSCDMFGEAVHCHSLCSDPDGCNDERKRIVRALLMGYLDSARRRGYKSTYIWSMPPQDGNHEYMFHMRPTHQHIPTAHQLESWYQRLLSATQAAGIITMFESNCNDDRRLPDSLFTRKGERSLRFAPQFPGGMMRQALDAVMREEETLRQDSSSRAARLQHRSFQSARDVVRQTCSMAVEAVIEQVQNRAEFGAFFIANFSPISKKERMAEPPMLTADIDREDGHTLDDRENLWRFQYDLHYQFNDLLHARYSTMVMLYHLSAWRDCPTHDKPKGGKKKAGGKKSSATAETSLDLCKPCEVAPRGDGVSNIMERWLANSAIAERNRVLMPETEDDYLCPTICDCGLDFCECKCRRFLFCEWCRSWQHQCCAKKNVNYRADSQHNIITRGFYDATVEYRCVKCDPCDEHGEHDATRKTRRNSLVIEPTMSPYSHKAKQKNGTAAKNGTTKSKKH